MENENNHSPFFMTGSRLWEILGAVSCFYDLILI